MDAATATRLSELTRAFYLQVGESFSASRSHAWLGWDKLADTIAPVLVPGMRVLDAAAGNLRFERFLAERVGTAQVLALDFSEHLLEPVPEGVVLTFKSADLNAPGFSLPAAPACDLAVCFGFMHHVPLAEQRLRLLRALCGAVREKGCIAVAFWQFADDERLLAKAREHTAQAVRELDLNGLGENDYLLGWQDEPGVHRFCHHFDEAEIDGLVAALEGSAREIARFSADGKSGLLNRYLVLER